MKKIATYLAIIFTSLGFTSCCSMFGVTGATSGYTTETRQVRTCHTDVVTEQVLISSSAKGGNVYETVERRVPRYKTVETRRRIPCGNCTRFYCPKDDCCGTTSESTRKMVTAQTAVGSPHIGLIPTMQPLAE